MALKKIKLALILFFLYTAAVLANCLTAVFAMPFYDLDPQPTVLRASFYTSYATSSVERKTNIALASKALDNLMIAPNEEFSFNGTVGERTEKRGYQIAKIIVNGEFVDGVGGGVCQVSTTLYNAVLLAGLKIIEFHPHSLPVNYVAPSFDAMVNSGWADLKFLNDTKNPIIIRTIATGSTLTIEIYGQPMKEKLIRESNITKNIPSPEYEIVFDDNGEFPDLYEGQSKIVRYGKDGYKSEGYLITIKGDKIIKTEKIRSDTYSAVRGKIVMGKTPLPITQPLPNK